MKQIAIYGAGGFGKEVAMLIEHINQRSPEWKIVGFFDDEIKKGKIINSYPVLGGIEEANSRPDAIAVVIAVGDSQIRKQIHSRIQNPAIEYPVLIHPSVQMSTTIDIGEGTVITGGCILTVNISIGKFVVINLNATIGHDSWLGDFVSLMPGVNLSGEVRINEGVYVGSGAQVLNKIEVGANAIIGAGAVVTRSVAANKVAVGLPARVVKDIE